MCIRDRIEIESDMPVARGLGSAAVMLAAGAFAANEIYARPLDSAKLLEITTGIEGHPDNLAPACLLYTSRCV